MEINYKLIDYGTRAVITQTLFYKTGIKGVGAKLDAAGMQCEIFPDGEMALYPGFTWDFGSGPAIDTPDVVVASAFHDAGCYLTNRRLVPWSCRKLFDKLYRDILKRYSANLPTKGIRNKARIAWRFSRRWGHWAGIRLYSSFIAKWRDKK